MDISQRGIDLIFGSEGKKTLLPDGRYQAYLDKLAKPAVWTIWAGLTHGVHEGMCLTEAECEAMFRKELNIYEHAVETMVTVPLNQNQIDALVSLVYNIGPGSPSDTKEKKGFYWSSVRRLLNQGKYEQAAVAFKRFNRAGGRVWPGLVTRRAKEASLFLEPMPIVEPQLITVATDDGQSIQIPETAMPQRVEESKGSITEALQSSWTIRGAASALGGATLSIYNWALSGAEEAGVEAFKLKTSLGPWDALFAALKVNLPMLGASLVIAGCGIVIARRLTAAREGKVG